MHQLVRLASDAGRVFDSANVVTDQWILDQQIRDTIKQFGHCGATVGHASIPATFVTSSRMEGEGQRPREAPKIKPGLLTFRQAWERYRDAHTISCRGVRKSFSNLNDIGAAACSVGSSTRSSVSLVLERYAHVNVDELRHMIDALPWAGGNSGETLPGEKKTT